MSAMPRVPLVTLNNGVEMPQVGLGLGNGLSDDDTLACAAAALDAGYRSFDTASRYRNERGLGLALARSGIPRDELFVTTKVWSTDQGRESTLRAFDTSLEKLGIDQVDLYLIHFPAPMLGLCLETWDALIGLQTEGRARAIGVSNFRTHHLADLLRESPVVPAVNQIELHPRFQQRDVCAMHAEHGITTEAWSPFARRLMLSERSLESIAAKYGATPAQVVLRWHLQHGNVVIPRSVTPSRMRENLEAVDLPPLDEENMATIDAFDSDGRTGPDPDEFYDGRPDWNESLARWNASVERTGAPGAAAAD
jgi:2,5-diketo-D-gluconate reductase A